MYVPLITLALHCLQLGQESALIAITKMFNGVAVFFVSFWKSEEKMGRRNSSAEKRWSWPRFTTAILTTLLYK